MGLFSPDRRRLTIASLMMLLGAILHTIGNLGSPPDPDLVGLRTAMQNYHIALGLGMAPSMWDIQRTLVFTMSICVAAIAWLGFAVAGSAGAPPRLIVTVSRIGLVISGALTLLCPYYSVPPPLITFAVITLFYLFAALQRPTS
jgi:hypothetical protein